MELVCPAGGLPALKAAVDHGADWVYAGLRDDTNARNFPGLNFDDAALGEGIAYAHARSRKVVLAVNTYPLAGNWPRWTGAIDRAVRLRADAVIVADAGLMRYARATYPELELHLSVQGSATSYEAINFFHEHFGVRRAVLSGVSLSKGDFGRSVFDGADLTGASLRLSNVARASFVGAKLAGADLTQAFTFGARFAATDLSAVKGLTQAQVDVACGDAKTVLPPGLKAPAPWPCED